MGVRSTLSYANLLGSTEDPDWKIYRYPFVDAGTETLAVMQPGYLIKFDAARANVLPALAADDAVIEGILIDLPDPNVEGISTSNASFADGVTALNSPILTSATGAFTSSDTGRVVTCVNLPANTVILSVQSPTAVTLSQNATVAGTGVVFTVVGRYVTVGGDRSVGIAVQGTFDGNQIHYADAHKIVPPATIPPLSAAAVERCGVLSIRFDPAVISGPFSP